jgi:hypothetical protein
MKSGRGWCGNRGTIGGGGGSGSVEGFREGKRLPGRRGREKAVLGKDEAMLIG